MARRTDTVATIAELFHVKPADLDSFNGWPDGAAHKLAFGDTVRIPAGATLLPDGVVFYGSLVPAPDSVIGLGATNDLTGLCRFEGNQIGACDPISSPTPRLAVRSAPMADQSRLAIYGIADADLSIVLKDSNGATLSQVVMTDAFQGRRAFAAVIKTSTGGSFNAVTTLANGDVLSVPIVSCCDIPSPTGSAPSVDPGTIAPSPTKCFGSYTLQAGQTPEHVAKLFDIDLPTLIAANKDNPAFTTWRVGAVILIPPVQACGASFP